MVDLQYVLEKNLAGRWIAGPRYKDALDLAKKANKNGISVLINYLGEDFVRESDIFEALGMYDALIEQMVIAKIKGDISIKSTELGLSISQKLAEQNCKLIV